MMGACVLFAALCSNMQLLFCCFVCYLERIYLLASFTDFAEVEVEVCVYPVCQTPAWGIGVSPSVFLHIYRFSYVYIYICPSSLLAMGRG
jgi:hypothetical protein